jgi:hypothetical protein
MSSLADLPELVGFFSYSREDDEDSNDALSALRYRIQYELRGQLGRQRRTFRLWQDKEAIAAGKLWESEIKAAVAQSVFFIPIITPTVVRSGYCQFELELFLAREAELKRDDLIFPILYIRVPELEDTERFQNYPVLSVIAKRQYVDWRELRLRDVNSTEVREAIGRLCTNIRDALDRPWLSLQESEPPEQTDALQPAEDERTRREAEAERRDDEQRTPNAELKPERSEVTFFFRLFIAALGGLLGALIFTYPLLFGILAIFGESPSRGAMILAAIIGWLLPTRWIYKSFKR